MTGVLVTWEPLVQSLTLQSPAKLNLYLRITGRRPDGYHNLLTLFHRISLADTLRLTKAPEGFSLKCGDPRVPTGEANLITKTYRLLQAQFPGLGGVRVNLKKRIPMGAGLGGGSSNAAAFLLGMKKLYRLPVSKAGLLKLGARLGADVPFFIHEINQGAGVERGDRIREIKSGSRHFFILAASRKGLSTKEVYENFAGKGRPASLTKSRRELRILCNFLAEKKYEKAAVLLKNDLEFSAFELRPSLRSLVGKFKKWGMPFAGMTGSGPTVFGIASGPREAKRLAKKLQKELPSNLILLCGSF